MAPSAAVPEHEFAMICLKASAAKPDFEAVAAAVGTTKSAAYFRHWNMMRKFSEQNPAIAGAAGNLGAGSSVPATPSTPKKRGRPAGSSNKPKAGSKVASKNVIDADADVDDNGAVSSPLPVFPTNLFSTNVKIEQSAAGPSKAGGKKRAAGDAPAAKLTPKKKKGSAAAAGGAEKEANAGTSDKGKGKAKQTPEDDEDDAFAQEIALFATPSQETDDTSNIDPNLRDYPQLDPQ